IVTASNLSGNEGQSLTFSGTFTDPGTADTHTASINWGDNSTTSATVTESGGSGSISASHVYADEGSYTIQLTVTDKHGGSATWTGTATIAMVAPTVTAAGNQSGVIRNQPLSLQVASFTEPGFTSSSAGTQETFMATIDWGDGMGTSAGTLSVTQGSPGVLTT